MILLSNLFCEKFWWLHGNDLSLLGKKWMRGEWYLFPGGQEDGHRWKIALESVVTGSQVCKPRTLFRGALRWAGIGLSSDPCFAQWLGADYREHCLARGYRHIQRHSSSICQAAMFQEAEIWALSFHGFCGRGKPWDPVVSGSFCAASPTTVPRACLFLSCWPPCCFVDTLNALLPHGLCVNNFTSLENSYHILISMVPFSVCFSFHISFSELPPMTTASKITCVLCCIIFHLSLFVFLPCVCLFSLVV